MTLFGLRRLRTLFPQQMPHRIPIMDQPPAKRQKLKLKSRTTTAENTPAQKHREKNEGTDQLISCGDSSKGDTRDASGKAECDLLTRDNRLKCSESFELFKKKLVNLLPDVLGIGAHQWQDLSPLSEVSVQEYTADKKPVHWSPSRSVDRLGDLLPSVCGWCASRRPWRNEVVSDLEKAIQEEVTFHQMSPQRNTRPSGGQLPALSGKHSTVSELDTMRHSTNQKINIREASCSSTSDEKVDGQRYTTASNSIREVSNFIAATPSVFGQKYAAASSNIEQARTSVTTTAAVVGQGYTTASTTANSKIKKDCSETSTTVHTVSGTTTFTGSRPAYPSERKAHSAYPNEFSSVRSNKQNKGPSVALHKGTASSSSTKEVGPTVQTSRISACPLCQMNFDMGLTQMDIDSHIAACLSAADDDVAW